jgi:hypothetical protein
MYQLVNKLVAQTEGLFAQNLIFMAYGIFQHS